MQKHSFAHTFCAKIKQCRLKKGVHQLPTLKKNITMVEPFAWSSGMVMVLIANRLRQPLCNGLVKGADEQFLFYFVNWSRNKLISKSID
jgi:hypothetical protein